MIPYELTIGCASSISNNLLPNILPALKEKYENLKVKIVTGHSKDVVQKVINNQVDFGIVRTETHPQIESIPIFSDPIGLFVPTHHPLASLGNINMNELEEQPFIFFDYGSFDWLMLHRLFQKTTSHRTFPLRLIIWKLQKFSATRNGTIVSSSSLC